MLRLIRQNPLLYAIKGYPDLKSVSPASPVLASVIDILPTEMFQTIAEFADKGDISSLRLTCRYFNSIFTPFHLRSLTVTLDETPHFGDARRRSPYYCPLDSIPDVFVRHIPSLHLKVEFDFTLESLRTVSSVARVESQLEVAPTTLHDDSAFWRIFLRLQALKKLHVSVHYPHQLTADGLFYFLERLMDNVVRATGGDLRELILDFDSLIELKSLPDPLMKLNSLVSFTLKRTCSAHFDSPPTHLLFVDWPVSPRQCCASPSVAGQLRSIITSNPCLRSFKYQHRCVQSTFYPSLYDVFPSSLMTMNIAKLNIAGYLQPIFAPVGVKLDPFPALNNLQHLELVSGHYYGREAQAHQLANIDHFWHALRSTRVALKTITTEYTSPAFLNYLSSFRGLQSCEIRLHKGCFSPSLSFTDLRNAYSTHSATLEKLFVYPTPSNSLSEEYTDLLFHNPLTCGLQRTWVEPSNYPKLQSLLILCLYDSAEIEKGRPYREYFSQFPAMLAAQIMWVDSETSGGFHSRRIASGFKLTDEPIVFLM